MQFFFLQTAISGLLRQDAAPLSGKLRKNAGHFLPPGRHTMARVTFMRIVLCLLMMLVMLLCPQRTGDAARAALSTWALGVVPSLFPYMVLCRMLSVQLAAKRFIPSLTAAAFGLIGGSPSGAAVLGGYAGCGRLDRKALLPLCALTGTISPMFMLRMAGGWLGGGATAVCLLAAHLLSAACSAAIISLFVRNRPAENMPVVPLDGDAPPDEPIRDSVRAILSVGGCIVLYSVMAEGMAILLPLPETVCVLLHALLEAAGGTHALVCSGFSPSMRALLVSAACGFSGLSIISQNALFVRPYGVSMPELVTLGLLRGALAALWMAAMMPLWGF